MMAVICYECGLLLEWDSNQIEIWKEKAESFDILMKRGETKVIEENKRLKEECLMYKTAADEEAGFADRLQKENRILHKKIEELLEAKGADGQ